MDILIDVLASVRAEIHRRHRRQLACIAERADTDDLYQMTCIKAWAARHKCRGSTPAEVRNWVFTISANECRNLLATHLDAAKRTIRRNANREPHSWEYATRDDPAAKMIAAEQATRERRIARAALRRLPPRRQQVVRLRYLRGWDYPRVAAELGSTVATSRTYVSEGIRQMRELVASA